MYQQESRKIAILWVVFEAVRRDKVVDFIASFWRSPRDLQDAAIKSGTLSRRTASKTALKIAIFQLFAFSSIFWKLVEIWPKIKIFSKWPPKVHKIEKSKKHIFRPNTRSYAELERFSWFSAIFWTSKCVFEAVRRDKVVDFIASFWRSHRDLQDAAIKSTTFSRWTPSKMKFQSSKS